MEVGAHLPQMTWGDDEPATIAVLTEYARMANELGFTWLSANDHVVYGRPWLDGPIALAAALPYIGEMRVATTIGLPVIRGPGPFAKAMAAIDRLSNGHLVVGVGPGSSERDYRAMGIRWEDRWPRFEEAIRALRALLRPSEDPFEGTFYSTEGMQLLPGPVQPGGPPIWLGSWGSEAGLRRVARLGDGWLASAYNTTPDSFTDAHRRLHVHLKQQQIDSEGFPNTIATMFMYLTEDRSDAEAVLTKMLAPTLRRPPEELRERLLVGPAAECGEKLARYAEAGADRILVWPVRDVLHQLERFHGAVVRAGLRST